MSFDLAFLGSPVSRETSERLSRFENLLREESKHQNLVARSTLDDFAQRHLADSAQLVRFAPDRDCSWVDIGSGAGLPGLVIACLVGGPVTLVEPRRLRANFLRDAVTDLGLDAQVRIVAAKAQTARGSFDVITARAVAALGPLLAMTFHLAHARTTWILPRGRNANSELEDVRGCWHCDAVSERSLTDPESEVLVLRNVRPRGRG